METAKSEIKNIHEIAFIQNFVVKEKQDRMLAIRHNRKKLRLLLAHKIELKKQFVHFLKNDEAKAENLYLMLKKYGASDICYTICENSKYDYQEVNLKEVLSKILNRDFGIIISCIPGKLAYYQGEDVLCKILLIQEPSLNV